jgi:hypothetical protein
MKRLILLSLLLSAPSFAAGINAPPAGWTGPVAEWNELYRRAEFFARIAKALLPGASEECVKKKLAEKLGEIEVGASSDSANLHPLATGDINIHPKRAEEFRRALRDDAANTCNGPGGGATAEEAVLRLERQYPEWDIQRYGPGTSVQLSPAIDAARGAAGMGVGIGAGRTAGAAAGAPASIVPYLDTSGMPDVRPAAVRKTNPRDTL